jgi:esterase/lipase superfamily enzyme
MRREYYKWWSPALGRDIEMLAYGQDGLPVLVFPSAQARFFEFEDNGMVAAVADKLETGRLQLFCIDSVDAESWLNHAVPPDWRIARHLQYESYILHEALPLVRSKNHRPHLGAAGCGLGGYHAVNIALRHPHLFSGCLSISGTFDLTGQNYLDGYYSDDVYFNMPLDFIPNLHDCHELERMKHNTYVLASGAQDACAPDNERLATALRAKHIPVRLDIWGDTICDDWSARQRMVRAYL